MIRVALPVDPYGDLFCIYCGTQWSEQDGEDLDTCEHLLYANCDEDPADSEDFKPLASDICFEIEEPAPASRTHYFVVRAR